MQNQYKRNLTIIIPHYNTPDLLEKLIVSIPNIDDIQTIVVDDNSDRDLELLENVKNTYQNRIEYYVNNTGVKGAGACRNIGLGHAEGKWLLFADADDYFLEGLYENVAQYFDSDYDEVFFIPTSKYIDSGELSNRHVMFEKMVKEYNSNPSRENLLKLKISLSTPCSKLVGHDLVKKYNIKFDEVLYFNDMMFSVKVGHYSRKIATSEKMIYCITRSKGSMTTQMKWEAYEVRTQEYLNVCDFLKEHYSKKDLKMMHYTCMGMLYRAIKNHYGLKKYLWVIKVFSEHKIPFFTWNQISKDSFQQIRKEMKAKRVDSKYMVRG